MPNKKKLGLIRSVPLPALQDAVGMRWMECRDWHNRCIRARGSPKSPPGWDVAGLEQVPPQLRFSIRWNGLKLVLLQADPALKAFLPPLGFQ